MQKRGSLRQISHRPHGQPVRAESRSGSQPFSVDGHFTITHAAIAKESGLGGCPFIKDAAGSVPTEDAVHKFEAMGIDTHIDMAAVCEATERYEHILGRNLPGKMGRVLETQTSEIDALSKEGIIQVSNK